MNADEAGWALELAAVSKGYPGGVRAIEKISLRLAPGRMAALVGPNGSGKSTLLKLWAGLARPTAGGVKVLGADPALPAVRARLGYLPDAAALPDWISGREFLRYLGRLGGLAGRALEEAVGRRARWAGLETVLDRRARSYSAGQRQRLGLAQALLHEPAVLLLDEPAAGLDPTGMCALGELLEDLRKEGRTIVFSSHFLPQVEALCDHAWLLREGRLIWEGEPAGTLADRFLQCGSGHAVTP